MVLPWVQPFSSFWTYFATSCNKIVVHCLYLLFEGCKYWCAQRMRTSVYWSWCGIYFLHFHGSSCWNFFDVFNISETFRSVSSEVKTTATSGKKRIIIYDSLSSFIGSLAMWCNIHIRHHLPLHIMCKYEQNTRLCALLGCAVHHLPAFTVFISGLWWALATAMIINSGVYQIFLSRIDWADECKRAWRRVGCKISVSGRPYQSDITRSSLEYTEKSGMYWHAYLSYLHDHRSEENERLKFLYGYFEVILQKSTE